MRKVAIQILKLIAVVVLLTAAVTYATAQTRYEISVKENKQIELLKLAYAQIGITEENNKGVVLSYLKSVGINGMASWCGAYQHWLQVEIYGENKWYPKSGLANAIFDKAIKIGKKTKYNVKRGDYIIWKSEGWQGHIGIIYDTLGNGKVRTIEGNTSSLSVRTGGCVELKTRSLYNKIAKLKVRGLVGCSEYAKPEPLPKKTFETELINVRVLYE